MSKPPDNNYDYTNEIYDSDSDDGRAFQELLRGGLTLRKKT